MNPIPSALAVLLLPLSLMGAGAPYLISPTNDPGAVGQALFSSGIQGYHYWDYSTNAANTNATVVVASPAIGVTTNSVNSYTTFFTAGATNWIASLMAGITNGAVNNISNYVNTVVVNLTNNDLAISNKIWLMITNVYVDAGTGGSTNKSGQNILYTIVPGTGGGGLATNAIANLNGLGTNTTIYAYLTVSNSTGAVLLFSVSNSLVQVNTNLQVVGLATFNSGINSTSGGIWTNGSLAAAGVVTNGAAGEIGTTTSVLESWIAGLSGDLSSKVSTNDARNLVLTGLTNEVGGDVTLTNLFATSVNISGSTANTLLLSGSGKTVTSLGNGGANTVAHGTTPPAYSAVVEADQTLADVTTLDVSITKHGYAPKAPNDATKFLNGVGGYTVPAGSGGSSAWPVITNNEAFQPWTNQVGTYWTGTNGEAGHVDFSDILGLSMLHLGENTNNGTWLDFTNSGTKQYTQGRTNGDLIISGNYTGNQAGLTNATGRTIAGQISDATNRPALLVDRSNILSGIITFPSATNSVNMTQGGTDFLLVSATPVNFTNAINGVAGYIYSADITVSNSTAAAFTNRFDPAWIARGSLATNLNTTLGIRAATVPASAELFVHVETRGINETNYWLSY